MKAIIFVLKISLILILLKSVDYFYESKVLSFTSRLPRHLESLSVDFSLNEYPHNDEVYDDECHCRKLPNVIIHPSSTCGRLSTVRGQRQKLLSYSFFVNASRQTLEDFCETTGQQDNYFAGIKKNLESIKRFYPGYSMRIYHDFPLDKNNCKLTEQLCQLFCQPKEILDLCNVRKIESYPGLEKAFPMMWRFAPMSDFYVEEWHSRDLDAVIIEREIHAVQVWKKTNYSFHIMRDHPYHQMDILGGMFGVLQNTPYRKKARLTEFYFMIKNFGHRWTKGIDQIALSNEVSLHASTDSLVHDSYLCSWPFLKGALSAAWPTQRLSGANFSLPPTPNFVGNSGNYAITIECPPECRPSNHQDWKLC